MPYLVSFFYLLLFGLLLKRISFFKNIPGLSWPLLVFFFVVKVVAGWVLIFIYTYYYTDPVYADVYKYFYDGRIMFLAINNNVWDYLRLVTGIDAEASHLQFYYDQMSFWYRPWDSVTYNDSRLVIRFNALVSLFSMGYLQVHNVFMNFLSFTGLVALYKFFLNYSDTHKKEWIAAGIFLLPGLLFWGSGVLKEGLLLWTFGLWIYYIDKAVRRDSTVVSLAMVLVYSFFLLLLKPYTLFLWIPCMLAFYLARQSGWLKANLWYVGIFTFFLLAALAIGHINQEYDVLEIIARKQNDFIAHSLFHDAGSLMHTNKLAPNLPDVVVAFIRGAADALLRPHILEAYSAVTLMAALENLLLLMAIFYTIIRFDYKSFDRYPIKWAGLWFAILLMGFVGMISVAYGGLVRYRIPALPFFWLFLVLSARLPALEIEKRLTRLRFFTKNR